MKTPAGREVRAARADDAPVIAALERGPRARPFIVAESETAHRARIAHAGSRYFIYEARDGAIRGYGIAAGIGGANRSIEVYRLLVDGASFGVGGDLLATIVRFGFDECGAHRVWSDCFDDNRPVNRMLLNYGFRHEGTLREAIWHDGRFRSVAFYGLLANER